MARGPGAAAPGPRHVRAPIGARSLVRMDPATLRAEFPVFERFAYLNAGTCGPLPRAADRPSASCSRSPPSRAAATAYFEAHARPRARACATAYARAARRAGDDVALTTCTSEGIVRVLGALDLQPGDEVLTSDEEHPGLQGPLAAARDQRGIARARRAVRADRRRGRAADEARRLLARELGQRPRRGRPRRPRRRAGAARRRPGRRRDRRSTSRRSAARSTPARARSGSAARSAAGMLWIAPRWSERVPAPRPDVHEPRRPGRGPRRRAARRRRAPRRVGAERGDLRRGARRARRARRRRLGRRPRARRRRSPRSSPTRSPSAAARSRRATARRSSPGRTPTRRRRARGSPRPA